MSRFKKTLLILIIGGIGGIFADNFVLPFLSKSNFLGSAQIINKFINSERFIKVERQVVVVTKGEYFSEAINKIKLSVVSIQSFTGGKMIRSGSGAILTQDGLIVTISGLVPLEAEVVQVSMDSKIYRAKVVARDYIRGLALLSLNESGFSVVNLEFDVPNLGSNLLIFSKNFNLGKSESSVAEALVSNVDESAGNFRIASNFRQDLYGASLANVSGSVLGLITLKNGATALIPAKDIKSFMDGYFSKQNIVK